MHKYYTDDTCHFPGTRGSRNDIVSCAKATMRNCDQNNCIKIHLSGSWSASAAGNASMAIVFPLERDLQVQIVSNNFHHNERSAYISFGIAPPLLNIIVHGCSTPTDAPKTPVAVCLEFAPAEDASCTRS